MSARNGDKARFQKDRKRKVIQRQRARELRRTLTSAGGEKTQPAEKK